MEFSPEQELFCVEFARTGNAVEAFKKSHKVTSPKFPEIKARAAAEELMANEDIRTHILDIQNRLSDKTVMTKDEILVELSRIARTSPFHSDRNRALDLLGKYHKMFTDKETVQATTFIKEQKVLQVVYMASDGSGRVTTVSPLRAEVLPSPAVPAKVPIVRAPSAEQPTDEDLQENAPSEEDILSDLLG